ncbi:peptidase [Trinickia caryophylli]|uniref:Predicted dienelactone hydrolase n=1 Tax=Trinickia caryophylli TaxID=28094 RepID=A0A1X7G6N2_TRICW|nr:peptidase [Trinickia caryophylli]PMS13820.1 peptidase [Trinickia caryophylli]TRX14315.1 peptidase [Trinickia caryophylli]WQE14147.1 peptidase [Trinickia caryophylli]SMF64395.1 Predicted dienelactone hydrolase [Trinickia caryophylli]GLU33354.1 dienelactone hydrolase [Trinickia caryophylli]
MLRRCLIAIALTAASWAHADTGRHADDAYRVGQTVRTFKPDAPREWRGAQTNALVTRIWYPADSTTPVVAHDIGPPGHPIFRGHPAADNAAVATNRARYPLLLLSHGTAGSADELDWLAAALASRGYIVAGVNHPGNNALEPLTREGFVLWWERATDLSEALDGMLADPTFGKRIDPERIGAVGFSLGGYTILELAGARTDLQAFESYCRGPAADSTCHPPAAKNEPVRAEPLSAGAVASLKRSGASYRDPRVKAVFALAPALGKALDEQSLARIAIPIRLVAGTADTTAPPPANILHIAQFLPHARVSMIEGARHETFLDTCVATAVSTHAALCKEAPGVDRDAAHTLAIDAAVDFFQSSLIDRKGTTAPLAARSSESP